MKIKLNVSNWSIGNPSVNYIILNFKYPFSKLKDAHEFLGRQHLSNFFSRMSKWQNSN